MCVFMVLALLKQLIVTQLANKVRRIHLTHRIYTEPTEKVPKFTPYFFNICVNIIIIYSLRLGLLMVSSHAFYRH